MVAGGAMNHELKIDRKPAEAYINGIKTFEIRVNDRDYKPYDTVDMFNEELEVTIRGVIGYISDFQQQEDYVVFSILGSRIRWNNLDVKKLTYNYLKLSFPKQMKIAKKLKVLEEEDAGLDKQELFKKIFERARVRNLLREMDNEINNLITKYPSSQG